MVGAAMSQSLKAYKHCEYQRFWTVHVLPATHVPLPVQPCPPHWAHLGIVPTTRVGVVAVEVVVAAFEVVEVFKVVEVEGLTLVVTDTVFATVLAGFVLLGTTLVTLPPLL
jgi:hypothetical protein